MTVASDRQRLLDLLVARSFARKRVVLASGRESDFFIDCKQTVLSAEGHALVGSLLLDAVAPFDLQAIAGVELGGCPLASAVALIELPARKTSRCRVRAQGRQRPTARRREIEARHPSAQGRADRVARRRHHDGWIDS